MVSLRPPFWPAPALPAVILEEEMALFFSEVLPLLQL
jgi:hypothetical protein